MDGLDLRTDGPGHASGRRTDGEPGSQTNPALVAARFLLKPGRKYEEAVKTFQPYDRTKEVNEEGRKAGGTLIADGMKPPRRTFIYVNNRLEGNALSTIQAMVDLATS